jgi:hypothetical protein
MFRLLFVGQDPVHLLSLGAVLNPTILKGNPPADRSLLSMAQPDYCIAMCAVSGVYT